MDLPDARPSAALHARRRIAAHVLVVPIARCGRDQQCHGIGAANDDGAAGVAAAATGGEHAHTGLEAQGARQRLAVRRGATAVAVHASHDEIAVRGDFDRRALRRLHPCLERNLPGPAGRQPHDDDLIRRAGEHFARERHAARRCTKHARSLS